MRRPIAAAGLAAALLAGGLPASAGAAVRAGAASADITAPVGSPMFAYTARSYVFSPDPAATQERALQMLADPDTGLYAKSFEPSRGIHTRVKARAIVLEDDGRKYVLAQADLGGLPYALVQEVEKRIADTGIPAERILLSATHTHSSLGAIWPADNSGYAFVGGDAFDPRTFDVVAAGIAQAIRRADRRLAPARVGVGTAQLTDASRNREYAVYLRNKDVPADPDAQRAASIDPTVTVVRVDRRGRRGGPLGVWSNFAIHPTSFGDGNLLLSGDNAGIATRLVERAIRRETGRRAVNVWTNGAEGDTSPDGDVRTVAGEREHYAETDAAKAHLAGARTAAGILRAWRAAGEDLQKDPGIDARRTFHTFDGSSHGAPGGASEPVGPFPVLGLGVVDDGRCAPVENMAGPGQGEKFPLVGGPGLAPTTMPVSLLRVGRTAIVAYPSEITKQMGERIRTALVGASAGALDRVAIAGMTNAYLSYTATPEEYSACTYEGSFTLMGRQMGYAWISAGRSLVSALVSGRAAPAGIEPPSAAFASAASTPPRATPDAGTALDQPAATTRFGTATLRWQGGDPQVDAPRGRRFVVLQRDGGGNRGWRTVASEDTFADVTERSAGDVWTHRFQFHECSPAGRYRFRVTGRAVRSRGGEPQEYTLASQSFEVGELRIDPGTATVSDGVARVRPIYPAPPAGSIVALARLVRDARVTLTLADGDRVVATDPDDDGVYTAPAGSAVTAVAVTDRCGNDS